MKAFGKIIICIIVIIAAIGMAYFLHNNGTKETNNKPSTNTVTNTSNINNITDDTNETNEIDSENTDYIGEEENKEDEVVQDEDIETSEETTEQENEKVQLTGKDKAIDIVKRQYAMDGQTVRFDHMEGNDYIIKINEGTAVTWYLVDGTTWEAEEY